MDKQVAKKDLRCKRKLNLSDEGQDPKQKLCSTAIEITMQVDAKQPKVNKEKPKGKDTKKVAKLVAKKKQTPKKTKLSQAANNNVIPGRIKGSLNLLIAKRKFWQKVYLNQLRGERQAKIKKRKW